MVQWLFVLIATIPHCVLLLELTSPVPEMITSETRSLRTLLNPVRLVLVLAKD
jgi:hypothetical protein